MPTTSIFEKYAELTLEIKRINSKLNHPLPMDNIYDLETEKKRLIRERYELIHGR